MRRTVGILALLLVAIMLIGCGETVNGMLKDGRRIGSGVKKVFVRDS